MYKIYYLISENKDKTYIGLTNNLRQRIKEHRHGKVKTTKNFGNFLAYLIDKAENLERARYKEKYWKSGSGRKKLKKIFENQIF